MNPSVKEQIKKLMDRLQFPEDSKTCFLGVETRFEKDRDYCETFTQKVDEFMNQESMGIKTALDSLQPLFEEHHENTYTMHMVFCLHCILYLPERYQAKGWGEDLFWDSMMDFTAKLLECLTCKNVPGTFVSEWMQGWLRCTRLALGRFQYDLNQTYQGPDVVLPNGMEIKAGTPCLNMHIPSLGGSLTSEVRLASYQKAAAFLQAQTHLDTALLVTNSWLLYPKHEEFLPKHLHILQFMNDFQIVSSKESEGFGNAWRVYGSSAELPVEEWPEHNSLQKAYKEWILKTNLSGSGQGIILMKDGMNITKL